MRKLLGFFVQRTSRRCSNETSVMADQLLFEGRLHSPFFVFLRRPHPYSDGDVLKVFGIGSYRRAANVPSRGPYAILADAGDWLMLADDWCYTLWHMPTTRPAIESLAKTHEVFYCSEG